MQTRTAYRVCPLCEAGCGLEITVSDERIEKIGGNKHHPLSKGYCCPKGIALKDLHNDPDRLRHPVIKENGTFRKGTWEEALDLVASKLSKIRSEHGNNAVALYLGNPNTHTMAGGLFIRPLIKSLKSQNIYTASTVDQMPKMAACGFLYGHPARIPVPDIDHTDLFVVFGANPMVSNGSLMTAPDMPGRINALQRRGGRMIVIDPVKTRTARAADQHLFIRPGTDAFLLGAIVNQLFVDELVAPGSLAGFVDDTALLKAAVSPFAPEAVGPVCGISPEMIQGLAKAIGTADRCAVYGRMGTSTVTHGAAASWLIEVINILTGNLDRRGGTGFPRPAHVPDGSFPKKDFTIGRFRSRVSKAPEIMGELPVSVMAEEIETPGDARIRALITVAGNPVLGIPESERLDKALSSTDFMVSVDYYINETTRRADVILPPASILCHGHYDFFFHGLSVRNFACYSPPVFEKNPDEKEKWEILAHLALMAAGEASQKAPAALAEKMAADLAQRVVTAMGGEEKSGVSPDMLTGMLNGGSGPERILDFLLRTGPYGDAFGMNPEGLNFEKLKNSVHGIDLGPLASWLDKAIVNPDGKIHLFPEVFQKELAALAEVIPVGGNGDDRLLLVGRRHLRTNNSWMHNISILVKNNPCTLYIHPADAASLGIQDGALVRISSEAGTIEAPAEMTESIMPGVVSLPHGWGHDMDGVKMHVARANPGVNTNRITPAVFDKISGTAVLNGIPVTVSPA